MTRSQEEARTSPAEQLPGGIAATLDALRAQTQAALERAQRRVQAVDAVAGVMAELKASGFHGALDFTAGQIVLTIELDAVPGDPAPVVRPRFQTRPEPVAQMSEPVEAHTAPAPKPVAPIKTTPWSKQEAEQALAMHDAGQTTQQIAAKLNRKPQSVGPKMRVLLDARDAKGATPEPVGPEVDTPSPEVAPVERGTDFTVDPSKATNSRCRDVRLRLRKVGYPAPWTPERDLTLVQGLVAGDGLGRTSEALGIDKGECKLRWSELLPEVTIEGQTQLLATLKLVALEAEG